jgi:membrane fusion protein (multidrug efflux system)
MSLPRKVRPLPFPYRSLGLALCAATLLLAGCDKPAPPPPPPAEVTAVTLAPQTVPVSVPFVAQVESSHQVEILARVSGFLDKILYKEGEMVKAGKVMFQIDPKPFQAQVAAAKGEVENRQAQLWTAKANLDRVRPLAALDAISKSDLDNATGEVQSAEASLSSAKANLDKAQLDLGYTTIAAPVAGVSGEALFREGTYLTAGASGRLSYVAQIDPIWVTFSVSQNQMAQRQQEVAAGQVIRPVDLQYQVELELSDGTRYPFVGKLNFISPTFSQETGTFLVRAELPNANGVLRPGMFVKANVKGDTRPNALVVPQKAVQQTDNGHVVYLATADGKAEIRPVIVGDWVGNDWVIKQGLKAGEQVIVDGFQRLKPGAPVKVIAPAPAAAPAAAATPSAPAAPATAPAKK